MAIKIFSKVEAIQFGWQKTKGNIGFFFVLLLIAASVSILPEIISGLLNTYSSLLLVILSQTDDAQNWLRSLVSFLPVIIIIISIGGSVLWLVVQMGLIRVSIKFVDNSSCKIKDLFSCFHLFFKYLPSLILYGIIILSVGTLLIAPGFIWKNKFQFDPMLTILIVSGIGTLAMLPAIILGIRFQFFSYFIVDKGYGPIEALKTSYLITKGHTKNLFLLGLLLMGINFIGATVFIIGLFITVPLTILARTFIYRKLLVQPPSEQEETTSSEISQTKTSQTVISDTETIQAEVKHQIDPIKPEVVETKANKISKTYFKDVIKKIISFKARFINSGNKDKSHVPKKAHPSVSRLTKLFSKYNLSPQFIISGIFLLISVILYFIFLSPLKSESIKLKSNLNSKADKLERYLRKGQNIHNEKWIDAKEQEIALIESELNVCKEILARRDKKIERVFANINGDQITDEALWKEHYIRKSNELIEFLKHNGFNINSDKIGLKKWNRKLPKQDEMVSEQKRFWIQKEIINIIVENRAFIRKLFYLKFDDRSLLANSLPHNLVTPIPFQFELEMEQSKILYLISDILNSELNFFIEIINLESKEKLNYKPKELFNVIYKIKIHAYVMDFRNAI